MSMLRTVLLLGLLLLLAGCQVSGCGTASAPAPSARDAVAEAGAAQVLERARMLYSGEERPFIAEMDYDTIIATLRNGVAQYPQASLAPQLQLMLANVCMEKRKYLNNKELTVFQNVSEHEVLARVQGTTTGKSTYAEGMRFAQPFDEAIAAYEQVFTQWPQSSEAQQALVKLAQLHEATYNPRRELQKALWCYQKFLTDYPRGTAADYVLFSMGSTYRELGNVPQAVAMYQRLLQEYPQFSPVMAGMARNYIAQHTVSP